MNHESLAFLCRVKLDPPSPSDKAADADRLLAGMKKMGLANVAIPLGIMRILPSELRKNNFELALVLGTTPTSRPTLTSRPTPTSPHPPPGPPLSRRGEDGEGLKILDIGKEALYGLALDIGSTNIDCSLFDLLSGNKLDTTGIENPQVRFGSDVLTRVQHSMTGKFDLLNRELLDGINGLIKKICGRNDISPQEIYAVTVAGNTIMSHFFLGLDVNNIPMSPYTPAVNKGIFAGAEEAGLEINEKAVVYVFPNSGSYVGGDIISGILFAGIHREEEPVLFIDVGTNVEITLGCRDWIMTGAGAAGPALEGGVAGIGKKAEPGTISRVRIDSRTKELELDVISGSEPSGICGSGLIDLVSELFSSGLIDQTGRLIGPDERIIEKDGFRAFLVNRNSERELYLTEPEIRNFLVSKAAMFSFLYVFVRSVGLTFRDIKKVYVAGALGCGINPESAVNIGMLPDIPRERFIPVGNSSLGGAEMVLLDRDLLYTVDDIASKITYREMNEDAELMSMLQGAMFIPHTEPEMLKG